MKTIGKFTKTMIALCAMAFLGIQQTFAQWDASNAHITVDWQMNAPLSTDFTDKISGWGMNFEGMYDVARKWSVGAFLNFHTNHTYVGRQTLTLSDTELLTTDQQRSAYQLNFGLGSDYTLYDGAHVKPYIGAKAGAAFTRFTTYYGTGGTQDKAWGFYVSPEIGLKIFPVAYKRFGFHVAGYYNYLTNQTATLTGDVNGMNNVGFRIGVIF